MISISKVEQELQETYPFPPSMKKDLAIDFLIVNHSQSKLKKASREYAKSLLKLKLFSKLKLAQKALSACFFLN
jgi:hypothetical protein